MARVGVVIVVMLALVALYYLGTTMFKPSQPQVVVVRPSGTHNATQSGGSGPTAVPSVGLSACTKAVYLKAGSTSLCADLVYSMVKTDEGLQVDFQGGTIQGSFIFVSAPSCPVTTSPQGIFIACRAQILIQVKQ
jgi:hypothetical protein